MNAGAHAALRPRLRWYAAAAFGLAVILTMAWQRNVGIARDEVVYMQAADSYARWWRALPGSLSVAQITKAWGGPRVTDNNREHPPLVKTLMGLSHAGGNALGIAGANELASYRVVGAAFMGLMVAVALIWAAQLWGVAAGLWAGALVLAMPRVLTFASVACFDVPVAAMWMLCTYAYWRAQTSRRWCLWLAVSLGLALATKHNALLLPWVFGAHSVVLAVLQARRDGKAPWGRHVARRLAQRWPIIAAMAAAPLVLVVLWPWLWLAPIDHLAAWIGFHLHHVHYNYEYLGANYNHPPFPWHVPVVTTVLTVPLVTLVAAGLGMVLGRRRAAVATPGAPARLAPGARGLLVLSAVGAMAPFALGSTPIFGAEKHWLAGLAILAMVGGRGVALVLQRLAWPGRRETRAATTAARWFVAGLVLLALGQELALARREGLAHYNALAGGASGGATLGMNRTFWGLPALQALPVLAAAAGGQPTKVYTHDAAPAWGWYRRFGMVPSGLTDAGAEQRGLDASSLAVVFYEKHFSRHEAMIWQTYGTAAPMALVQAGGVPVAAIYRRPVAASRTVSSMRMSSSAK